MKTYEPVNVRVVGIFGHRGSGKTSLTESLLFSTKATTRLGSVPGKNVALELDEEALERETTMHANVGFVEWAGKRIGMIDTPGDGNFWGSALRASKVVDGSIICISAPDGVENITLRAHAELAKRQVPCAVVVTKLDKEAADLSGVVAEIKSEFGKDAVLLSLPMKGDGALTGVISLLSQKAYLSDGQETDIPAEYAAEVEAAQELLYDAVAAADDELAEKYLEEMTLTEEELQKGLRAAFLSGSLTPVLSADPSNNIGTRPVLDVLSEIFPSPEDAGIVKGHQGPKQAELVERPPASDAPLVLQIFRTFHDPFAGVLSFGRVWSGTIHASGDVFNTTRDTSDRPSHLYFPRGGTKNGEEVKQASVGDLVILTKLKSSGTGDTLSQKDDPTFLPTFDEPEALLNFGILAKEQKDEDKLSGFIQRRVEEDPSLKFKRDPSTNEMLLGGLGQAHIDYVVAKLKRAGIEVDLREPKVPYRETLRGKLTGIEGKHKKQSGGHGQFGVCFVNVEPQPRGTGTEFVDQIVGGSIPRGFIPSVEKGIRDTLTRGPISGNEVVDVKITLYDGKYHRVDSSDMAFQAAGRKAVRAIYENAKAKPVLLEPYMHIDIACPADNVGDVMGDLNSRRARVENMTTEGRRGKISASVPMNEILRYTNVLKSLTSGRGSFTMRFDRYEEAPPNIQQQVEAAYQQEREAD